MASTPNSADRERLPYRLSRRPEQRIRLLGQTMDLVRPEEVLHFIAARVKRGAPAIVANHNAHSLYLLRRDEALAGFYRLADLVEIDSTPLLMWARFSGRRSSQRFHRCTYLDWRDAFWTLAAENGWRVFYLGGAPGVAALAADRIMTAFPGVEVSVHHGYFDRTPGSDENAAVVEAVGRVQPHVLMVGMGMPIQETWISANLKALPPCVTLPVGAAFDYEAGVQRAAPRWLGQLGLEWLYRLVSDPSRLFRRYCVEPWTLGHLLVQDWRETRARLRAARGSDRRSDAAPSPGGPRRRAEDQRGTVSAEAFRSKAAGRPVPAEPKRDVALTP
ncbi:MAG: WecB/TagA/CpsF family glycosyltransferase [Caulobacter sp.]|nr:WecB/TagA/CpsF family glycosyltransferase [Caulobacter sp.]